MHQCVQLKISAFASVAIGFGIYVDYQ